MKGLSGNRSWHGRQARRDGRAPHGGQARHDRRVSDVRWAAQVRWAVGAGTFLLVSLLIVDHLYGRLTWQRAALWAGLSLLLCVVLVPPRVTAGPGWLAARDVWGERRVRTDRMVALDWQQGAAGSTGRIVLRDAEGTRLELDLAVLTATPAIWLRLEEGARRAQRAGTLVRGAPVLARLAQRVEQEAARAVFTASGLSGRSRGNSAAPGQPR
ncbi:MULTISPECIES: hypothetical protein [unclassified Streptomyces]|uniref:hypothetical protein n=1 Tax=unclassified Streptomyces TaxID=2593676 RepID=UPI002E0EEEA3|nr:hypothetical protein OG533_06245 [Streptomyces sp. NBC_01186]WSS40274.1 hypothetical protein OG220_06395 [Streptomyces sp. NBC_01187]